MESGLRAVVRKTFAQGPTLDIEWLADLAHSPIQVLFGPSGSGKSTFLRMLCGLCSPDRGSIRFKGKIWFDSVSRVELPPQLRRIGFVPQMPALFPHLTVQENIAYSRAHPDRWLECLE